MRIVSDTLPGAYEGRYSRMSTAEAVFLAKLGHDLRAMYTDVLQQPLPDDLTGLIERIDTRPPAGSSEQG